MPAGGVVDDEHLRNDADVEGVGVVCAPGFGVPVLPPSLVTTVMVSVPVKPSVLWKVTLLASVAWMSASVPVIVTEAAPLVAAASAAPEVTTVMVPCAAEIVVVMVPESASASFTVIPVMDEVGVRHRGAERSIGRHGVDRRVVARRHGQGGGGGAEIVYRGAIVHGNRERPGGGIRVIAGVVELYETKGGLVVGIVSVLLKVTTLPPVMAK